MIKIHNPATRRKTRRSATILIASLLITSATLRLGTGAGTAIAQAVGEAEGAAPAKQVSQPEKTDTGLQPTTQPPKNRAEMGSLLEALNEREAQLRQRERQAQMRQKALEVADREISKRIRDLEDLENRLRQTLTLADGAAEGDLAQLTTVYENMKAKDAAKLFEAMEPAFAAGFLGRMRPDTAAAIMAGLTPEIAYTVSVILAGRNANAPKS